MIPGASLASALALLAQAALPASGAGRAIVEHGNGHGAGACATCHGARLQGTLGAPALAGRPAGYILQRLDHYASPQSHNAFMKMVATSLTPAERQAVAGYIAHLPTGRAAARRPG
jgi:cytochrome c553